MKKICFFIAVSFFYMSAFANGESVESSGNKIYNKIFINLEYSKKAGSVLNEEKPFCRACCTINVTSSTGNQSIIETACVRHSDCATAATSACNLARLAAAVRAFQ